MEIRRHDTDCDPCTLGPTDVYIVEEECVAVPRTGDCKLYDKSLCNVSCCKGAGRMGG